MNKQQSLCPVCRSAATCANSAPFCSNRCRQIDLYRWCEGRYAIVEDLDPQVAQLMALEDPSIAESRTDEPSR